MLMADWRTRIVDQKHCGEISIYSERGAFKRITGVCHTASMYRFVKVHEAGSVFRQKDEGFAMEIVE